MKLFSFSTIKGQMKIGIEIDNRQYDFTQIWEFFKDIKGSHQTPALMFLQVMIELTFFNFQDIKEVLKTVQNFRSLHDVRIRMNKMRVQISVGDLHRNQDSCSYPRNLQVENLLS